RFAASASSSEGLRRGGRLPFPGRRSGTGLFQPAALGPCCLSASSTGNRWSGCSAEKVGSATGSGTFPGSGGRRTYAAAGGPSQSYYELLGTHPNASQAEIKRAYISEAKKYHPDVNPSADATKKFQQLAEAYQALSNPARRAEYDRRRDESSSWSSSSSSSGARRSASAPPPPGSPGDHEEPPVNPADLFRTVFEEMGGEQILSRLRSVQKEASEAARHAQDGNLAPAKDFAWRHKGLAAAVLLPLATLLRFPHIVGLALRGMTLFAAMVLQNPSLRELVGRFAWMQWRLLVRRAAARSRNKPK
ncbi:unnamed protein product, partial [Polarella glacialis]